MLMLLVREHTLSGTALKGSSTGQRVCGAMRSVPTHTSRTTFQTTLQEFGFGGLGFFFLLTPGSIHRTWWAASLGFPFQRCAVSLTWAPSVLRDGLTGQHVDSRENRAGAWRPVSTPVRVYPCGCWFLAAEVNPGEGRNEGERWVRIQRPGFPHFHIPTQCSEDPENSKSKCGLPGHCEDIFVKAGK